MKQNDIKHKRITKHKETINTFSFMMHSRSSGDGDPRTPNIWFSWSK